MRRLSTRPQAWRIFTMSQSAAAPEKMRTKVKVAASTVDCFSAARQSSELLANAIIASSVSMKTRVDFTTDQLAGGVGAPWLADALGQYFFTCAVHATEFHVSRTCHQVIVDHAGRLHQRVADRGADEFESASQQIAAHRIGFGRACGHLCHAAPAIPDWLAPDKTPKVRVEAFHFLAHPEKQPRVLDGSSNLQSVSHDPGVAKQPLDIARAVAGDLLRAESIE